MFQKLDATLKLDFGGIENNIKKRNRDTFYFELRILLATVAPPLYKQMSINQIEPINIEYNSRNSLCFVFNLCFYCVQFDRNSDFITWYIFVSIKSTEGSRWNMFRVPFGVYTHAIQNKFSESFYPISKSKKTHIWKKTHFLLVIIILTK